MDTGISTTLLSGVLKVKLPDTKQNLMKSPWRDRLCVLEESGNNNSDFKIFKANTTKSTSKLYQSVSLCGSTSVWKDSNPKSATFYLRESGKQGEIACLCSSFEECNQWVEAIQKKIQTLNHQTMLTMQHDSSLSMKQPKEDEKSMSEHDSIRSAPSDSAFLTEARNSQEIIGGHIEPIRIQKSRNLTNAPIFAPTTPESIGQSTVAQVHPNTAKLISSSIRPEGLDIPLFTSPMSSNHTPAISVPFWLNLESGTPAGEPGVDLKSHRALQLSPVRKDFNPLESMKLELSELTQLNNSLYQKIETLQEEKRVTLAELENERSLYQQRVEDLKTRNLLTNEECRSLHEDIYRLKTELKDLRTRYEEEILKTSTESTIHQQLETYRQLSESLTKENIKLSTDIAKLGRQMSDHENSEKKSASTIKLLLEKNSHLENEQLRLQESFDHLNRAHTELLREKDELNNKYQALSSKHKRSEIELRKLQGRFHEEIQSEVHAEAERMTLLEEECSRLQTEIFTTKNERNQWELENIRLNEELAKLKATVESMNVSQHVELVQQMELLRDNLLKSQQDNEELRRLLQEKGKEREDLTTRLESLKCDAKEWKKASKQQLIDAEAKISKMQTEILRLNADLVESEKRCVLYKERVLKLETEAAASQDSRTLERQSQSKLLSETQLQLESVSSTCRFLEEKNRNLEQSNRALQYSLSDSKSQLEETERLFQDVSKALKSEKSSNRQLQDAIEILKMEKDRDLLQYEEKLRRINSLSGESKQTLFATETRLHEVTAQLFQDKHRRDELTHSLQSAEMKCEEITSEVKKLQELRKQDRRDSEAQLTKLKQSLRDNEGIIADLRMEVMSRNAQIESLTLSLQESHRDVEANRESRKECLLLEQKLQKANEEISKLEHEIDTKEKKLRNEMQKSEHLEEAVAELQSKCLSLQDSLHTSLLKEEKMEGSIQTLSLIKESLESRLAEVTELYHESETRLSNKCLELKESLDRVSELHLQLTSKHAELQHLQSEHQSLKKSFKFVEDSLKSSELCVETVNFSCKTLHEEIDGLNKQIIEWKTKAQHSEKLLQDSQHQLNVLQSENTELQLSSTKITETLVSLRDKEAIIENMSLQLSELENVQQDLHRELSLRSKCIAELNEQLRAAQVELEVRGFSIDECQKTITRLNETLESSRTQHFTSLQESKNEIQVLQNKCFQSNKLIQELELLTESKESRIAQLEDQNQKLSATIADQEASFKDRLSNAVSSLEEQMSTMYSKLTDCMTESSQTNRTMRDSLKKLSEIYVLLSCCIDNNRPEGHSLSFQVDDQSCHDHLKTNLERSISHVQELSQKLSDEFARLCGILHSLSHENSVFLHQILTLSRELPSPIREKCVRQICDLEALENWQEVETDSTGITKEMAHLEVYQRRSQLLNVASLRFSNELIAALLQLQKDHQVDLQYQHSQLEAMYQKMMSDLQDSHSLDLTAAKNEIKSLEGTNMILMETIQRRELETCRILREKEEYERILRAKLTSDEYKLLMSSRSFTTEIHLEQPMLTSRSNDGENEIDSPVPVPLFELSSIYKTMPLAGGELEEKKSCGEDLSPHQLLKRNRGASVSLNIRREQLFPSTPHPISNSHLTAKSRHKSNHATNGRIVALLGGSRISSS